MKKILIAIDYDPSSQKLAETVYPLAKLMNAELTLLHVINDPVYYTSTVYSPIMGFGGYLDKDLLPQDLAQGLKDASLQFLDKTKEHLGDDDIKTIVKEGDIADAILEAAQETGADIIAMGSHSRKWLEQVLMGSVTEKVLRHSIVPLFIVPTKKQD